MKKLLLTGLLSFCTLFSQAKDYTPQRLGRQSLHFLENNGQVKDERGNLRVDIDFTLKNKNVSVFISNGKLSYKWYKQEKERGRTRKMDIALDGCNRNVEIITEKQQSFETRFCKEGENIVCSSYDKVTYKNIYNGIDWVLYIKDGMLEYDFVVHEGADVKNIKLTYSGASKLKLDEKGGVLAVNPAGNVTQMKPVSFTANGQAVASAYKLNKHTLSFEVGKYDGTLVIDPVLTWATYYGGFAEDRYISVVSDDLGNIYAAGTTGSATSIATNSTTFQGGTVAQIDGFVSKYDVAGNLAWTTYYGTAGDDFLTSIAVDGANAVYVLGYVDTSGNADLFVAKLSTSGNALGAIGIGGSANDVSGKIHCSSTGDVYICGQTKSAGLGTTGTYQPNYSGGTIDDGFIAKLDAQLNLLWFTYYGTATGIDYARGVCTDMSGHLYVTGYTSSTTGIATFGMFSGITDVFVSQFDAATGMLNWGTYLGGSGSDVAESIDIDGAGSVYVCGVSNSTSGVSTVGSHQPSNAGNDDAILAKFNSSGILQWCTYYGSSSNDVARSVNLTAHDAVISGNTDGTDLLVTDGFQQSIGGNNDAFAAKFNKNTGAFFWGTYYGGVGHDFSFGVTTDINEDVYVAGYTASPAGISYNTNVQATIGGIYDGFLAKISDCDTLVQPTTITGNDTICAGTTNTYSIPQIPFASLYVWTKPSGWTGNSFTESITLTANTTSGPITVYAYNGCDTTAVITLNVGVIPLPVVTISQTGNVLSASGTFAAYQWYLNGSPISGATNQAYTATQGGSYYVVVTEIHGCTGQSTALPVGVNKLTAASAISVFPNPTKGDFSLKGKFLSNDGKVKLTILDITGRIIREEQVSITANEIDYHVQLDDNVPAGAYILRLHSDNNTQSVLLRKE